MNKKLILNLLIFLILTLAVSCGVTPSQTTKDPDIITTEFVAEKYESTVSREEPTLENSETVIFDELQTETDYSENEDPAVTTTVESSVAEKTTEIETQTRIEVETAHEITNDSDTVTDTEAATESTSESACLHVNKQEIVESVKSCNTAGVTRLVCSDCGELLAIFELGFADHTEGEWIVEKNPTETESGVEYTLCTVCGEKITRRINATGHSEGLEFSSNGDGSCTLVSIGNCKDLYILVPPTSPTGEVVKAVGDEAFSDFYMDYDFVGISIPDTVEIIGNAAFSGCDKLEEVILPKGLKVIGERAFGSCFLLEEIVLPDGVTDIGRYAFANCNKITSLNIPSSVERIGAGFISAESVISIDVDGENQYYRVEENCLISSDGVLVLGFGNVSVPDGVEVIGESAFAYNRNLGDFILPAGIKRIETMAFSHSSVTEIVIPYGVDTIPQLLCFDCDLLESIFLPESVVKIEKWAIDECPEFAYVTFGGSVEDWEKIDIDSDNEALLSATVTCIKGEGVNPVRFYGKTTLSGTPLYVYELLVDSVMAKDPVATIEFDREIGVTEDDLLLAKYIFLSDYPECFWWRGGGAYSHNGQIVYNFSPSYDYTGDQLKSMKAELDAAVDEIVASVPDGSVFEQVLFVHDLLAKIITYKFTDNDQTPYGALVEGEAVCNGYATSYQLILEELGIRAWTVNGTAGGVAHAWNVVWLDDETCVYTDVTWDDQDEYGVVLRYYFNMSLEEIDDDHNMNEFFVLPECNHTDSGYYDTVGVVVKDTDRADKIIDAFEEKDNGVKIAQFRYDGRDFYAWLQSVSDDLFRMLGNDFSISYITAGDEIVLMAMRN